MKDLNIRFLLIAALATSLEAQQAEALKVSIVEGQGGVNSIRRKTGAPIIVEVRDDRGRIVPAARVQFSTPATGPTAKIDGRNVFVTWTDTEGRARAENFAPNQESGSFPVIVEASFTGRKGTATFNESNSPVDTAAMRTYTYSRPNHKVRNTVIIAGIVGAAALAIVLTLALRGGKTVVVPTPTTISIGGIAVGGPQ